jgi:hypothetical protein
MSTEEKEPEPREPRPWGIRPDDRSSLFWGALACLTAAGLSALAGALIMHHGIRPGFTPEKWLPLVAIVFEIGVVATLVSLTENTRHKAVGLFGGCAYACAWLLTLLALALEDFVPTWLAVVLYGVIVLGVLAIIGALIEEHKSLEAVFGVAALLAFVSVKVLLRQARRMGLNVGEALGIGLGVVLLVALVAFTICYSVALLRGGGELGLLGSLLGLAQLAGLGLLGYAVYRLVTGFVAVMQRPELNDQQVEQQLNALLVSVQPLLLLVEVVPAVLTAMWFLSLRGPGGEGADPEAEDAP